jgi:UDP-glucose 4-epimerase
MRLVAGSSGVLGSGFCEVLRARGEPFVRMQLSWDEPDRVAAQVVAYWHEAQRTRPDEPITLVWAAGRGSVAAEAEAMAAETETLRRVVGAVSEGVRPAPGDGVLFASSAGALYGGHRGGVIGDTTPPAPITPYGREKLLQEGIVAQLAEGGVMRVISCRFTNVFGLAGGRLRPRGLVAALAHSAMVRQPARIFVTPDTRRDYLYNLDAARLALAEVDAGVGAAVDAPRTGAGRWNDVDAAAAQGPQARIIRAGTTMTVLDLIGSISRVLRRRVPVVITESAESRVQPRELHFRPRGGVQAAVPTTSFAAAIRVMAAAPRG